MWLASEMAAFALVCELKSFTAAARALGVPKVAISRAIASLEQRLGSRLLIRTTRRVSLTPAGELLRPHCQRLLLEVEAVRARFGTAAAASKRLHLITDSGYGRMLVTPLVPRFLERYGDVELTVTAVEALPGGPGTDWDLLICNGARELPGLAQTLLGRPPLLLCATPAYLARHGRPRTPADLATHVVLRPSPAAAKCSATAQSSLLPLPAAQPEVSPIALRLRRGAEEQELRLRPALQVDDPGLVHASTAAGLGIAVLPEFLCRQGLAMGKLERVLPDWTLAEPLELKAVYAKERESSVTIRLFLEFLLANMVPVLSEVGHRPKAAH